MKAPGTPLRFTLAVLISTAVLFARPLAAATWLPFGPDGGDARRIVADPTNHSHLYLGTVNGWIYESFNAGDKWRRLARIDKRDDLVLDSIVVDRQNPKHLVVGAFTIGNVDGGMYLSDDAGKSWTSQAEMRGQSVRSLTAAPSNSQVLVAGTLKGVFLSADSGRRWHLISPPDSTEIHEVESVAFDPVDPQTIYAGTWHLPWKTTDGGEHWESIKQGIIEDSDVFSIIVDPGAPNVVYASACSGIYKSDDAGTLFHKIQGIPSTARRTRVLMQDPNDADVVFAGTTEGLWRTDNAGRDWKRITGPEIIVNDVSIDRTDSKHLLVATDRGGVLASEDGGDSFHASNGGFSARQITAMYHDTRHPATLLVGVVNDKEWGGVFRSDDGGLSWQQLAQGLQGRDVFAITQAPDGTYIAGTAHGLFRFDKAVETWMRIETAPAGARPLAAAGANPAETTHLALHVRAAVPIGRNQYAARVRARSHPLSQQLHGRRSPGGLSAKSRLALHSSAPGRRSTSAGRKLGSLHTTPSHSRSASARPQRSFTRHAAAAPPAAVRHMPAANPTMLAASPPSTPAQKSSSISGFDGSVYAFATSGDSIMALTSIGLLASDDNGQSWTSRGPEQSQDWRFVAAADSNIVAASLHSLSYSKDGGSSWSDVLLPQALTQVGAVAVEASGRIWAGGREGIFVSKDAGATWFTPKNLFVNTVNSIFYDEASNRMMVTTGSYSGIVFLVHLKDLAVTFDDTGWNLRFARPIGDHLIAATLYDGIVVEAKMMDSPLGNSYTPNSPTGDIMAAPPAATAPGAPPVSPLGPSGVPVVHAVRLPNTPD